MKVEAAARARRVAPAGWAGPGALLLAVLVVAALLRVPDSLLLPFPWQEREREDLVRDQRAALYLKIDRAAKTWFLLKGSFPDRLQELVAAGLLSPGGSRGPRGPSPPVRGERGELHPAARWRAAGPCRARRATEAITGNFLLDPESSAPPPSPRRRRWSCWIRLLSRHPAGPLSAPE